MFGRLLIMVNGPDLFGVESSITVNHIRKSLTEFRSVSRNCGFFRQGVFTRFPRKNTRNTGFHLTNPEHRFPSSEPER